MPNFQKFTYYSSTEFYKALTKQGIKQALFIFIHLSNKQIYLYYILILPAEVNKIAIGN
jgi:hypothetical protein